MFQDGVERSRNGLDGLDHVLKSKYFRHHHVDARTGTVGFRDERSFPPLLELLSIIVFNVYFVWPFWEVGEKGAAELPPTAWKASGIGLARYLL